MISELEPVWKQFTETYDALRQALAQVPEDRLHWQPTPGATSVDGITRHIVSGNLAYSSMIAEGHRNVVRPREPAPNRERLLELLDTSEQRVKTVFEQLSAQDLCLPRADGWMPLGVEVSGPLDVLWFAQQIVRHSAYHLGQINYILLLLDSDATA
ncbi:MAG TPA: DinB family protein [Chthonomonadaceae bacterium]|nr:DinB family protein [Chthonomonadaceae bacterium]